MDAFSVRASTPRWSRGRCLHLTPDGDMVLAYAKSILRLHDELLSRLSSPEVLRLHRARYARSLCRLHPAVDTRGIQGDLPADPGRVTLRAVDTDGIASSGARWTAACMLRCSPAWR